MVLILFSCGNKNPYPYKISDFRTELQNPLKILSKGKEIPSRDTIARNFIADSCTKEELLKLLNCEDPVLRVIAYRIIVNRKDKDYFKILLGHLNDTTKVTWWYAEDAANDFMVSDMLIMKAIDSRKLTKVEKNILVDSVLLKHLYLRSAFSMMIDIEPKEKYYSIIKKQSSKNHPSDLTKECEKLAVTYALAKYKKEEDIEYIKNNFKKFTVLPGCNDYIFKSIEVNPHEAYFSILLKYFNENIKKKKHYTADDLKYYCRAIAKYQNKESLALLMEILDKNNYPDRWSFKYNQESVFKAIHKYKAPIYEDLYKKLKPKMSEFVMEYLDKPDYSEYKTW
jgi:hypothetical protein